TKKTTGGGLPVEIWSRFMRPAHQGVPVASLPGVASGGFVTAGYAPPWNASPAPLSNAEAPVQAHAQAQAQAQARAQVRPESGSGLGLDGWLIDRLMGRR